MIDDAERRNRLARYRAMERETTDPLAAGLLHGIVAELEAETDPAVGRCDGAAPVLPPHRLA